VRAGVRAGRLGDRRRGRGRDGTRCGPGLLRGTSAGHRHRGGTVRRLRAAAAAVALLVAATGCEAVVGTDVTVTGVDEVRTEVAVTLTGAAAEAFGEDAKLLARLERLVEDRAGTTTARTVEDDLVEFRARVEPGRVADASGLTGVAGIS